MSTSKTKNAFDLKSIFNVDALSALSCGCLPEMIAALNTMYQDVFTFGLPNRDNEIGTAYLAERMEITSVYNNLLLLFSIFERYPFDHYDAGKENILVSADESKIIRTTIDYITRSDYVGILQKMMVVSVSQKHVILQSIPTEKDSDLYCFYTEITNLIKGYNIP